MGEQTTPKGSKAGGWTDHELLVYIFALIEHSKAKLDIRNAPRPNGRSVRACEQKIQNVKSYLKADVKALIDGQPIAAGDGTPMSKKGRKRKGDESGDVDGTPSKRGRNKMTDSYHAAVAEEEDDDDDIEEWFTVKDDVKVEEVPKVKKEVKAEEMSWMEI